MKTWNCLFGTSNREPFFQPCSHPAASKQQMAGLGAVVDLVQLCLLGSNCVLTWRETKYYSHASKQIIVTLLAGRWLYLSPCPDGVRRKEIRPWCCMDWMYLCAQFRCVHLTVCLPVCLSVFLPVCLPVYLLNSCLSDFSYISLSVFVLWQMFQCCRSLYKEMQ